MNVELYDYIEFTGSQYIDTGFIVNQNSGFEIDFVPESNITSSNAPHYLNSGGTGTATKLSINCYPTYTQGEITFGNIKRNPYLVRDTRMKISIINKVLTLDNGNTETLNPTNFSSNSIYIGAVHNTNAPRRSKMKLYSLKLYDGNLLIYDFKPAKRLSDNVYGLYEAMNDVFFTNNGTGTFVPRYTNSCTTY